MSVDSLLCLNAVWTRTASFSTFSFARREASQVRLHALVNFMPYIAFVRRTVCSLFVVLYGKYVTDQHVKRYLISALFVLFLLYWMIDVKWFAMICEISSTFYTCLRAVMMKYDTGMDQKYSSCNMQCFSGKSIILIDIRGQYALKACISLPFSMRVHQINHWSQQIENVPVFYCIDSRSVHWMHKQVSQNVQLK